MALTPESLIEQQMQPLPSSSHSCDDSLFWDTVRAFSMSVARQNVSLQPMEIEV